MRFFDPLRSIPVALLWGGLSLSALGDQLYIVALTWIAVGVLGAGAGYLSALQAFVVLLAVLGIGRWADRWPQLHSMVMADLARAGILLLVVGAWLAVGSPSATGLIAAVVVLALGQAVFQPAMQSVLPVLVSDRQRLPAANGLLDATDRSARMLGPALVGLLAGVVPAVHFLTLDAFSFGASALAVLLIARRHPVPARVTPVSRGAIWQNVVLGYRAMAAHPLLRYILATKGLTDGAYYAGYFLCLPLMIARYGAGGTGLGTYGLVISAYGCTNLAANVYFGGRMLNARPQFQIFSGNVISGMGLALLGVVSILPAHFLLPGFAAAAALGGIGGPMKDIPVAVLRQTRLKPMDVAAGMRAYMASSSGGTLLSMLLMPWIIAHVGVIAVIIACGAVYVGVGAVGLLLNAGWIEAAEPQPA